MDSSDFPGRHFLEENPRGPVGAWAERVNHLLRFQWCRRRSGNVGKPSVFGRSSLTALAIELPGYRYW